MYAKEMSDDSAFAYIGLLCMCAILYCIVLCVRISPFNEVRTLAYTNQPASHLSLFLCCEYQAKATRNVKTSHLMYSIKLWLRSDHAISTLFTILSYCHWKLGILNRNCQQMRIHVLRFFFSNVFISIFFCTIMFKLDFYVCI